MNEVNSNIAILIMRVSLGVMFIAHGLLKLMVFTLPGTAQFFAAQGFPGWTAYPVTFLEVVGGLLLISGIATRWIAISLIPVLLGALYVHLGNGWVFSSQQGGWEYPAFLLAITVVQAIIGPGDYAIRFGNKPLTHATVS